MLRYHLLENSYFFELKEPKKSVINLLWGFFAILFILPSIWIYLIMYNGDFERLLPLPYINFNMTIVNVIFIGSPFIYFIAKEVLTTLFCADKNSNMEMKLSPNTEIPISVYREAFKTWQIIIIYLAPLVFMYPFIFIMSIMSGGNINLLILLLIMSFLMSFDVTLATYVLFLKIRYDAEYIAINNHIYSLTLYSKKKIESKIHDSPIKIIKTKIIQITEMPQIQKIPVKKICVSLILVGVVAYSAYHFAVNNDIISNINPDDFNTYIEYCDATKPMIKKYSGDVYDSSFNTIIEESLGCEILAGGNLIYCNDDGSVIYFDSEKNSIMRLDNEDRSERLCIYEECRNNLNERCGHMPNFISGGCYSDGVLYGVRQYWSTYKESMKILKSYVIRYDIYSNKMDKLIEFEMGDDDVFIRRMEIDGSNLYVWYSAGYDEYLKKEAESLSEMLDLTVARIDLANKSAYIIYSENARDKEQAMKLTCFHGGYIYGSFPTETITVPPHMMPVSGTIYKCDSDMKSFNTVVDLGYITVKDEAGFIKEYSSISARKIDIYNEYIYYIVDMCNEFCRYNMKMKKIESLTTGVQNFYINGDFLYYTMMYGDNSIYRVKLDGDYTDFENKVTYVDFTHPTAVYKPKPNDYFSEWGVKDNCIYILSYPGGKKTLSRIKINSISDPYIIW